MNNLSNNIDKVKKDVEGDLDMPDVNSASIKNKVDDFGSDIKNSAVELGKDAMSKVSSGKEYLVNYVNANPLKSLGIAFIAGIILAKYKK